MKKLCLLFAVVVALSGVAQAALTIEDSAAQKNFSNYFSSPINITSSPWDFSGQAYQSLTSISTIGVTMTMGDGDTGLPHPNYPEFDRNDLILFLDGIDTGLRLNNFGNNQTPERTNWVSVGSGLSTALLAKLDDGKLIGTIFDVDPGDNIITLSSCYDATIYITGETTTSCSTVPAPGAFLLCGCGATVAGWLKRRRSL